MCGGGGGNAPMLRTEAVDGKPRKRALSFARKIESRQNDERKNQRKRNGI